jgi:hypothetical protein
VFEGAEHNEIGNSWKEALQKALKCDSFTRIQQFPSVSELQR